MIGVLGAYGAVGRAAVGLLADTPGLPALRIGGRNLEAAEALAVEVNATSGSRRATARRVDLRDPRSLREFVDGTELVVNCAGPASRYSALVAKVVAAAGVDLVDAGGDERLAGELAEAASRVVLGAGALPGLSGLLPLWLAAGFGQVQDLVAYFAVADRFTPVAAEDYLQGVLGNGNQPLAGWRGGHPAADALARRSDLRLPYLPEPVTALPFLDEEAQQVARRLGLTNGSWFSVLEGTHLLAALDRSRTAAEATVVADVCRAAALDLAGREPRTTLLVQATNADRTRTAVLRGEGISAVTGAVAGIAAVAVLTGEVRPGAAMAAAVLDPGAAIERLRPYARIVVLEASIDDLLPVEEGVL